MQRRHHPVNCAHLAYTCLVVALSGCATDPYVTLTQPETSQLNFDTGVAYANTARLDYQHALSKLTREKTSLSNALIVLGGVGVGMVAGGVHRSALGYTAIAGGTAYTLGTWNSSQPRENAYLEGMRAMDCVLFAAEPLKVGDTAKNRLATDMDSLALAITGLNTSIGTVEVAARQPGVNTELSNQAKSDVNIARGIVNTANETYVAARQVETRRDNAGLSIVNTVNALNTQVNKAIQGTIPDLSALPSIIKGLASTSDLFVPGAGLAESVAKIAGGTSQDGSKAISLPPPSDALNQALTEMKGSAENLASLAQRIQLEIQNANSAQAIEKMRSCGIEVDLEMQVTPNQLTFREAKSTTKHLIVSGGKKPYTAAILEADSPVSVKSPFPAGDSRVEVIASDTTRAGDSYTVFIQDATNKTKAVTVTIQADVPATASKGTKSDVSKTACPAAKNPALDCAKDKFSAAEASKIQTVVGAKADGEIGKVTRQKICAFQKSHSLEEKEGWVGQKTYDVLMKDEKWKR